jgi:hypothetical protein
MVQATTPVQVDAVMVGGRIAKRGGKLVACDVDKIVREGKMPAQRIRTAAGGRLARLRSGGNNQPNPIEEAL